MNTQTILLSLGLNAAAKGYKYLVDAIDYQVEHNNDFVRFYRLYDTIAEKYNVKSTAVQKCIFYCIGNRSLKRVNKALWRSILGEYDNAESTIPSNKDFICSVAQYIVNKEVK